MSKNRTKASENIKKTKNTQKRETHKSGGICEDRKKGIYSRPPSPKIQVLVISQVKVFQMFC